MTPPSLSDNEGIDLAAWLCTVPGIPAGWPVGSLDRRTVNQAGGGQTLDNLPAQFANRPDLSGGVSTFHDKGFSA